MYGRRTSPVRELSVGAASFAGHTGPMATDTRATRFMTGAAGFIGSDLVKVLVARRHRVFGLTDSLQAADRVHRTGHPTVEQGLRQVLGTLHE